MKKLEIRPVEAYELDSWDALVEQSPAGTLYHTSTWRNVINASHDEGSYALIGAYDQSGLVGGFTALTRKRLGVETAVTPLLTPYVGFLTETWAGTKMSDGMAHDWEIIGALTHYLRRFRYQNIQCAPGIGDFRVLADAGYKLTPRATLEINLRLPEEELWESFQGHVRRNIKKAQRAEFEINDQWNPERGVQIFQDTFRRHGQRCPVGDRLLLEVCDGSTLNSFRRRYCAYKDGRMEAYLVALRYNGRVYYQVAAADADALKTGISSLLVWEMLRDHVGEDWDVFDFLGANTRTISKFKEGYNPSLRTHLQAEICSSRRIGFGRGVQRLLRRHK